MKLALNSFVGFWRRFEAKDPPFAHPDDLKLAQRGDFDLNLLPMPINGSLIEAECVILMVNPGLDIEDYEWERNDAFRSCLIRNLNQSHSPGDYPLHYLDPAFEQHPGSGYWSRVRVPKRQKRDQQKLRELIDAIADRDDVIIAAAQAHVSRKVAILQLCPYHSAKKPRGSLLEDLPSCQEARKFVHELVISGEKLVVATRSAKNWGFCEPVETESLIVYPSSLGASASLSLSSKGGVALLNRISRVT